MTFAIPVKARWVEVDNKWHVMNAVTDTALFEVLNCEVMKDKLEMKKDKVYYGTLTVKVMEVKQVEGGSE